MSESEHEHPTNSGLPFNPSDSKSCLAYLESRQDWVNALRAEFGNPIDNRSYLYMLRIQLKGWGIMPEKFIDGIFQSQLEALMVFIRERNQDKFNEMKAQGFANLRGMLEAIIKSEDPESVVRIERALRNISS